MVQEVGEMGLEGIEHLVEVVKRRWWCWGIGDGGEREGEGRMVDEVGDMGLQRGEGLVEEVERWW